VSDVKPPSPALLAGSPPPLASLHAQAGRILEGQTAAFRSRLASLRGYPVVVNKWDLAQEQRRVEREEDKFPHPDEEIASAEEYRRLIQEALKFIPYAPVIFASAKTGYHVQSILETVINIAQMRFLRIPTSRLNEFVQDATRRHHPATFRNKPIKVYYATQTRVNPPTFVFFVNDPQAMHFSYERYLENRLREAFGFRGTAIRLQFRARSSRDER